MSSSSIRSPRPASMASYQASLPHLPSPLNSSPASFSPPIHTEHTPRSSSDGEMSDTLSPLRERLDAVLSSSPRSSPTVVRPPTSAFSRSPELSPVTSPIPLQPHHMYARHSSPSGSPFAQGVTFSSPSPLSSSFAGSSQTPQHPRPFSPSSSPRPGSPTSVHSTHSQFQTRPLRSPSHPTPSHFHLQTPPIQVIPSPHSRFTRAQSFIQPSFGNPCGIQAPSTFPDNPRNRRVSLGAESRPHLSTPGSPMLIGHPFVPDTLVSAKGDSTPLNEAPIRWWGGQRSWVDDWDSVKQSYDPFDPYTARFSGHGDFEGKRFAQSEWGNPLTFREPFGCGGGGPGPFRNEEIRASFDGGIDTEFAEPLAARGQIYASTGASTAYRVDGMPVSRAVPITMIPGGSSSRIGYNSLVCAEVDDGTSKALDNLARFQSCRVHSHGNAGSFILDSTMPVQRPESGRNGRSRRFSDASTHSSTSYASCLSGPSQSQSQSIFVSSQSHTSTCPSLSSLGIGIEEAEREELRSKTIWRRRNSGSTLKRHSKGLSNGSIGPNEDVGQGCRCSQLVLGGEKGALTGDDGQEAERVADVKAGDIADSKQLVTHTREKDTVKHGSSFFRGGSKHVDEYDEQAQRDRYNSAEKYVSLAITSILPATTITMLSPFGEALVKAKDSAKYVGQELAPVLKDTLSVSADLLSLAPLPGLEEAAKALLCVWDACQKVDTNRLSCLRLAERCATLLYSVRCEVNEAGVDTALALAEPVEQLCSALVQIRTFLETQLHRPFLKRYVRREEIARELVACNEAITDAASKFGISVQIRTYQEVLTAMNESKRFAMEARALWSMDHQLLQRQYAMMYEQQVQTWQVSTGISSGNALGLSMDEELVSSNGRLIGSMGEERNGDAGEGHLAPFPACGPLSSTTKKLMSSGLGSRSEQNTQTSSILSTTYSSDATNSNMTVAPTPTRAMFIAGTETGAAMTTTTMKATADVALPFPMHALAEVHQAQDAVDAAVDEAALRGTLAGALKANNDVDMVRCLQVARGEIFEAAETLRRMLDSVTEVGDDGKKGAASDGEHGVDGANAELDRKFMQSGIEAMTRLTRGERVRPDERPGAVGAPELPSWTITRYEVIRTRKIGMGFFSDVYLGHWRKLQVVIKVLAHSVSREAFVRHVEMWNTLDHPNVLPLYGASSALGEKPWFFVSKFCSGGNLAAFLKSARVGGQTTDGRVDLLRCMLDIAKGMAYLHERGVTHGDLRAESVLVDENNHCVLSDFGQCEIKSEAHKSCGQPEPHLIRWRAPEKLTSNDNPTCAVDVYAFAMCCIEILGMGDLPWETLDDMAIRVLVVDKNERPSIPVLTGNAEATNVITNLVQSCWAREPDHRPSFTSVASSLEEAWRCQKPDSPRIRRTSTPVVDTGSLPIASTESSPADEQYETASESMTTEIDEEGIACLMDVSLTSPIPVPNNGDVLRSVVQVDTGVVKISTHMSMSVFENQDLDTPTASPTNMSSADMQHEENYRLGMGLNHAFHGSLTLALWSPTRVEVGAVGYLSRPKGEFITLFNAMDPLQSCEERLRRLPSMYGYGKFEVQKRDDGKRSVAQRGLDAISGFLTFKARGDRSHLERIARQYTFPLVQGSAFAQLCVEKTTHRYIDHSEAPKTWFKQHVDVILDVLGPRYGLEREDLILVVGTLDAPDWAVCVSNNHSDGRVQFNVFSYREKGEPWGAYTEERAAKHGNGGPARCVDTGTGTLASKVSCVSTTGGHDLVGDTVMLAGLRFEKGMQTPTMV